MIPKLAATAMSSDSDEFAEGGLVVHRVRTSLPETVSEEDREKFESVVTISPTGKATLSTTFTAAIDAALARLKALPS